MNLSGISPLLGLASSVLGGAQGSSTAAGTSNAAPSNDPLAAVLALTQDVDKLATSGLGGGLLGSLLGGGSAAGSLAGLLA